MTDYKSKISEEWYAVMRDKFQTDDAGVREIMRNRQKKSMANRTEHKGGFNYMTKEELSALGKKGMDSRWSKQRKAKQENL